MLVFRIQHAQRSEPPVTNMFSLLDKFHGKLGGEQSRTQGYRDVADCLLWIRHLLVAQRDSLLSQFCRLQRRLWRLVLSLYQLHIFVSRLSMLNRYIVFF